MTGFNAWFSFTHVAARVAAPFALDVRRGVVGWGIVKHGWWWCDGGPH